MDSETTILRKSDERLRNQLRAMEGAMHRNIDYRCVWHIPDYNVKDGVRNPVRAVVSTPARLYIRGSLWQVR